MVLLSVKQIDGDGFLFETTTDTLNDDLIQSLVNIYNNRLRSIVIVDAVKGLATYGPVKEPSTVERIEVEEKDANIEKGPNYTVDPTGNRTGNAPDSKSVDTLIRVSKDLESYIEKGQVQRGVALTESIILDKIANVRGAVMMAYPMGLPQSDTVKIALDSDNLHGTKVENELLEAESVSLWAMGKEFERGKQVSNRLGKNEKTKVIAKLQNRGSGPPGREPIVSEEERKVMMAHYFKRQEELKRLAEVDEDDYLNSEWADNKQMKKNLQGLENVKAPGLRF